MLSAEAESGEGQQCNREAATRRPGGSQGWHIHGEVVRGEASGVGEHVGFSVNERTRPWMDRHREGTLARAANRNAFGQ